MNCCPNPIHCILPPYILDKMAESDDPQVRKQAVETIARSATLRATRVALANFAMMTATPSADGKRDRVIYDMKGRARPSCLVSSYGAKARPGRRMPRSTRPTTTRASPTTSTSGSSIAIRSTTVGCP